MSEKDFGGIGKRSCAKNAKRRGSVSKPGRLKKCADRYARPLFVYG